MRISHIKFNGKPHKLYEPGDEVMYKGSLGRYIPIFSIGVVETVIDTKCWVKFKHINRLLPQSNLQPVGKTKAELPKLIREAKMLKLLKG